MPIQFNRSLIASERTRKTNLQLGVYLAAVAGAINAGGFLAVQQYTSHMTGIVSSMVDNFVLGQAILVWSGLAALVSFLLGAMLCAIMVSFARKRQLASEYAIPLALEAILLLVFGMLGSRIDDFDKFVIPLTAALLCFMMGLQNALMSKISNSEIRTTHITGIVTDLGIELGRLVYINKTAASKAEPVMANRPKLMLLGLLLSGFVLGAIAGAIGFKHHGYVTTVPIALSLLFTSLVSIWDDIKPRARQ